MKYLYIFLCRNGFIPYYKLWNRRCKPLLHGCFDWALANDKSKEEQCSSSLVFIFHLYLQKIPTVLWQLVLHSKPCEQAPGSYSLFTAHKSWLNYWKIRGTIRFSCLGTVSFHPHLLPLVHIAKLSQRDGQCLKSLQKYVLILTSLKCFKERFRRSQDTTKWHVILKVILKIMITTAVASHSSSKELPPLLSSQQPCEIG